MDTLSSCSVELTKEEIKLLQKVLPDVPMQGTPALLIEPITHIFNILKKLDDALKSTPPE